MCRTWSDSEPCVNYRCRHNLFWEELGLNRDKIQMTDRALEIRNCCRRIRQPWTPEEIGEAWGLTKKEIRQCEAMAWRKVWRESQ